MATPSIRSQGSTVIGTSGGTNINVPYPASIVADDILVLAFGHRSTTIPAAPAGWTLLNSHTFNGNSGVALWGKRATGAESGSVARLVTTVPGFGVMFSIQDVPAALGASYFEGGADAGELNNGIPAPTIITAGAQRLALFVGYVTFASSPPQCTGESGGDWTSLVSTSSASGNDGGFTVHKAILASGGTISGGRCGANTSSGRSAMSTGVALIGLAPASSRGSYVQIVG